MDQALDFVHATEAGQRSWAYHRPASTHGFEEIPLPREVSAGSDPRNTPQVMSRESVESLLARIESWNAGEEMDFEEVHPDFEIVSRLSSVQGEPYRGHEGIRQWRSDIDEQFTERRIDMDEIRELGGGRYLGLGRVHLRGRGSGVEFDQPLAWVFELRDGKWSQMSVYANSAEALEAAGLTK